MVQGEPQRTRYFSERHGLRGPQSEVVGGDFWEGFVQVVSRMANEGMLSERFGNYCSSSTTYANARTSELRSQDLDLELRTQVGIHWPLVYRGVPDSPHALDTVEFFSKVASMPRHSEWHDGGYYQQHYHYTDFDRSEGTEWYREKVQGLFDVHNHPFTLADGLVERKDSGLLDELVGHAAYETGDHELDVLLEQARHAFYDIHEERRQVAIEKLWDAWERLKSLRSPDDKKRSVGLLLSRISEGPRFNKAVEEEAQTLTALGNELQIRHHEKGKEAVNVQANRDYLYYRLYALIWRLVLVKEPESK